MQRFPQVFSELEKCQAMALIDEVSSVIRIYDGNYQAPWLLSSIYAPVWWISKGKETRYVDGVLSNYFVYDWSTKLYDGTNLIDPINKEVLHGMQRLAFLAREMPGGPNTLVTHKNYLWTQNLLVRWVYINSDILKPRDYKFTNLKTENFIDFFTEMGEGGVAFVLRYPERVLNKIIPAALGRLPTTDEINNYLYVDREDSHKISQWLDKQGAFEIVARSRKNEKRIKHAFLANLINIDTRTLAGGSPKWDAFLGQFTSSDVPFEKRLDNKGTSRQEYPSQKSIPFEDARNLRASERTLWKYFSDIKTLVALHRHLPEVCPDPREFKPDCILKVVTEVSEISKHTPWIPLNIAMDYTTEALRWVHVYGEDLVSLFLSAYRELYDRGLLVSAPVPDVGNPSNSDYVRKFKAFSKAREEYVSGIRIFTSLKPLNLSGWKSYMHFDGKKAFEQLRISPSLNDAIMVLIGAVTIVVAMAKPIRDSEFRALKADCLYFADGDGYWLAQDMCKKNLGDIRPTDARPIPVIAAKGIQLLRRLTDGLKEILGITDPWLLESLMTFPSFGRYEAQITEVIAPNQLGAILDAFCDYVALPPDEAGRRWYLRIHEMRKSFLITFFWTYRYASLDAARWMAGHSDSSNLYAYIQANFPGEELPRLEAEYASQVLRNYKHNGDVNGIKDVDALYQKVCEQFSVLDVSWIDEGMLRDWLELQFESRTFQIIPYSIPNPDGGTVTEIAFRVSPI